MRLENARRSRIPGGARRAGVLVLALVLGSGCKTDKARHQKRLAEKRRKTLSSLPYLASRPASRASLKKVGVVLHDRKRAWGGYNLYCPYHGDRIRLINMKGELVHAPARSTSGRSRRS
jgi:hypothetical protein